MPIKKAQVRCIGRVEPAEGRFSSSHLTRLFHDHIGMSPMQYVTRQRLTRAAALLEVSTLNIAENARSVGYSDPYHFSRRFKQVTGYAPTHYRAARRGDTP
ncbi:helix-turn-helix transcriptional regulator [Jiangella alkaliphila]|uniref:helix-turn-helix transcriptional regulator n=1 Tax=Jiangella alkaliphila TaxID=419479 RepID=UPI0006295DAE|nr:helix-turn-helix transcriptional regulator [Jiangella alkaliphila]